MEATFKVNSTKIGELIDEFKPNDDQRRWLEGKPFSPPWLPSLKRSDKVRRIAWLIKMEAEADDVVVHERTIDRWLNGTNAQFTRLEAFAKFIDSSVDELILSDGTESAPSLSNEHVQMLECLGSRAEMKGGLPAIALSIETNSAVAQCRKALERGDYSDVETCVSKIKYVWARRLHHQLMEDMVERLGDSKEVRKRVSKLSPAALAEQFSKLQASKAQDAAIIDGTKMRLPPYESKFARLAEWSKERWHKLIEKYDGYIASLSEPNQRRLRRIGKFLAPVRNVLLKVSSWVAGRFRRQEK